LHSEIQQESDLQFYNYDGAKISYRKYNSCPSTSQQNKDTTLLLIHPIGIGQASWFWDKFISDWFSTRPNSNETVSIYTVNLLGCGVTTEKNAQWNMTMQTQQYTLPESLEMPVSLPLLSWVKQCESLMEQVICQNNSVMQMGSTATGKDILPQNRFNIAKNALIRTFLKPSSQNQDNSNYNVLKGNKTMTVVAQGGLAPVATLLAARNPGIVTSMILTSPPTFDDLTKCVLESELRFNYKALCNPLLENIAFSILESRWAIQFFSNLFLFARPCDIKWINRTMNEAGPRVRKPVQLFNAGYCSYRSYQEELCNMISQPTLILRGTEDIRDSDSFAKSLKDCTSRRISGKNVLPWESSLECCSTIKEFLGAIN
jgi:pimeloyl-ACP methyl ester carboxylesterase